MAPHSPGFSPYPSNGNYYYIRYVVGCQPWGWALLGLSRKILRPFLGIRILKTGLAAFGTLVLFNWLGHDYVPLAAVSAILAMQPSISQSRKQFTQQLQGNLVGSSIGLLLSFWPGATPFTMALGVVLVLGILVQRNLSEVAGLSAVVLIFIMQAPREDLLVYVALRVVAITAGMITGYLINQHVRPPRFADRLTEELQEVGLLVDGFLKRFAGSLEQPERFTKQEIKAEAAGIQKRLESVRYLLELSAEGDVVEASRDLITKTTASMFVFVDSIMEMHKAVLRVGGLGDPAARSLVEHALETIRRHRAMTMSGALGAGEFDPASGLALQSVLADLGSLVDGLVDRRESRPLGMALHEVGSHLRHMANRMDRLTRLLVNRSRWSPKQEG